MPDANQASGQQLFAGTMIQLGGIALILLSAASYLFFFLSLALRETPMFIGYVPVIVIGIVAAVIFRLGQKSYVRGKKMTAVTAEQLRNADRRPPVLYLRSFKDDPIAGKPTTLVTRHNLHGLINDLGTQTEEEVLANELMRIGPPVAVGKPDEDLPQLGFARKKFSNEEWESGVKALMLEAKLVVMRAGDTEGTLRELEMARDHMDPTRLLLLIPFPPDKQNVVDPEAPIALNLYAKPQSKDGPYFRYKEKADLILRHPLPDFVGRPIFGGSLAGMIWFDREWNPTSFAFETTQKPLKQTLAHVFSYYKPEAVVTSG